MRKKKKKKTPKPKTQNSKPKPKTKIEIDFINLNKKFGIKNRSWIKIGPKTHYFIQVLILHFHKNQLVKKWIMGGGFFRFFGNPFLFFWVFLPTCNRYKVDRSPTRLKSIYSLCISSAEFLQPFFLHTTRYIYWKESIEDYCSS